MSKPSSTNYPNGFLKARAFISFLVQCQDLPSATGCSFKSYSHEKEEVLKKIQVVIVVRFHLFPFRTEKLSSLYADGTAYLCGRVGSRLFKPRYQKQYLGFFCALYSAVQGVDVYCCPVLFCSVLSCFCSLLYIIFCEGKSLANEFVLFCQTLLNTIESSRFAVQTGCYIGDWHKCCNNLCWIIVML